MWTCRELIDFLADYLDGALPAAERDAFEEHLAACPDCQAYLDSYRQTILLSKAAVEHAESDQKSPPLPPALVRAVLQSRAPRQ